MKWKKQNLLHILGSLALDIQHIGSTSINRLDAKPIIDIAIGLDSLSDFEKVRQAFEKSLAYSVKEDNVSDEILIRKGPENNRTHFIHVMESKGQRMKDSLKFRDILRSDLQIRDEYCKLKRLLANKYPNDRESYTADKSAFIKQVLRDNSTIRLRKIH